MLSNFDIENIAETMDIDLIGVFSKDRLPNDKKAGCYIVNLQDYDAGGGTHWVSFKIFENGKVCFFDSFGIKPAKDIEEYLKIFKPIAINTRQIQDIKSDKCGYFCLCFCYFFKDFNSKTNDVFDAYDDFLNMFSKNLKQNDKIVMEMLGL